MGKSSSKPKQNGAQTDQLDPITMATLSEANTNFCLSLFQTIAGEDRTGNIFFSPLSISSALAMVLLGARGNTATQMSQTLNLHKAKDDVHVGFSQLMAELNKPGVPYTLDVANRLYGEKSYQFVQEFLSSTQRLYNAELETVDFRRKSEAARVNINAWVEKQTRDKIKNLLQKGAVNDGTKLVLVNAIYFKGNWEKMFEKKLTKDETFKLSKNDRTRVKMMYVKSKFPLTFIRKADCQILELPYVGKDLSMLLMLPNDIEDETTGLEKLEKELTYKNFVKWTRHDKMEIQNVRVGLPRFRIEETMCMNNVLGSMGMVDVFDRALSDLSGMSPGNDFCLSQIVHEAFVEVNEEGAEAAAATAARLKTSGPFSISRSTPEFIADHPFLFFIRHNHTSTVLFYGRCCSP